MNTNLHRIVAAASLALPLSANALLISPTIDVYGTDGMYNAAAGGASQSQVILDHHDPYNPPAPDDIGYGTTYYDELRANYSYSWTDSFGVTASTDQSAYADLQFATYLLPNSGGQVVFQGDADVSAAAVEHGGCTDLGGLLVCNYVGPAWAGAVSTYTIYFELFSPHTFSYVASTGGGTDTWLDFYYQGTLANPSGYVSRLTGRDSAGLTGVLEPGQYYINAMVQGVAATGLTQGATDQGAYFTSWFDYSLTLTPTAVPIPAAIWLFGSGLLGLVGAARRKAK